MLYKNLPQSEKDKINRKKRLSTKLETKKDKRKKALYKRNYRSQLSLEKKDKIKKQNKIYKAKIKKDKSVAIKVGISEGNSKVSNT